MTYGIVCHALDTRNVENSAVRDANTERRGVANWNAANAQKQFNATSAIQSKLHRELLNGAASICPRIFALSVCWLNYSERACLWLSRHIRVPTTQNCYIAEMRQSNTSGCLAALFVSCPHFFTRYTDRLDSNMVTWAHSLYCWTALSFKWSNLLPFRQWLITNFTYET